MSAPGSRSSAETAGTQAIFEKAVALHQSGQIAQARALYEAILASHPRHFDSLHMLGVVAYQGGNPAVAHDLIVRAMAIRSDVAASHANLGTVLRALGRPEKALASYERAIRLQPDYATAYHDRGNVLLGLGRLGEAVASFDEAIALGPDDVEARLDRGSALARLGYLEEALNSHDAAIALRPDYAVAHYNRGNALLMLGRPDEALASYERAVALAPDFAEAHNNRGNALSDLHRLDAAVASYDRAIVLRPAFAEPHNNRGNALWRLARAGEALASYERAVALHPDYAEAYNNRGNVLLALKHPAEALASFERALALKPDHAFLPGAVLNARMKLSDWAGLDARIDACRTGILSGRKVVQPFVATMLFDEPELHKRVSTIYAEALFPNRGSAGVGHRRSGHGKIRVGYYSSDLHDHATARLIAELFELHDDSRFEFFAFSFGPDKQDAMRTRLSSAMVNFIDVECRSDSDIAALSMELGIDIAVDLNGYTQNSRPGIFARRCAPIQVNYLGYPGTMGADYFDYIIADKIVIPPEDRDHYTEKIVYLPDSYQVNDGQRPISNRTFSRGELGLPEAGFIFCCFNNNQKILPRTFDRWMNILNAVAGSILWLYEDNAAAAQNLRGEAEARGVDGARLCFARHMPLDEHLARHRLAGLFLDSWPYNAHTTASDALWTGVPVLTCAGRSFASRVAASLLGAVGLPELITHDERAYEARAIELAAKPARLAKIRSKLDRNRPTAPLFDARRFARNIERAYLAMYERHRTGQAPDAIDLTRDKSMMKLG